MFCFTGRCSFASRSDLEYYAKEAGALVTKTVTKATTILVIVDIHSQSSKAQKARANGIKLINPDQFMKMCQGKEIPVFEDEPEPLPKKTPRPKVSIPKKKTKQSRKIRL